MRVKKYYKKIFHSGDFRARKTGDNGFVGANLVFSSH